MIEFQYADTSGYNGPTFGEVQIDQFFIDMNGFLCQRKTNYEYQTIANQLGEPWSTCYDLDSGDPIKKKLQHVSKISFN